MYTLYKKGRRGSGSGDGNILGQLRNDVGGLYNVVKSQDGYGHRLIHSVPKMVCLDQTVRMTTGKKPSDI